LLDQHRAEIVQGHPGIRMLKLASKGLLAGVERVSAKTAKSKVHTAARDGATAVRALSHRLTADFMISIFTDVHLPGERPAAHRGSLGYFHGFRLAHTKSAPGYALPRSIGVAHRARFRFIQVSDRHARQDSSRHSHAGETVRCARRAALSNKFIAALRSLDDASNPLRLNNFAFSVREPHLRSTPSLKGTG
jgi:hypothetical protein